MDHRDLLRREAVGITVINKGRLQPVSVYEVKGHHSCSEQDLNNEAAVEVLHSRHVLPHLDRPPCELKAVAWGVHRLPSSRVTARRHLGYLCQKRLRIVRIQ